MRTMFNLCTRPSPVGIVIISEVSIPAWYVNCIECNHRTLQRVVRSARCITGGILPALQDIYSTRCHRKAKKIIKDLSHPSHGLFTPLPSKRRGQYRCIKAESERLKNSFSLKAIRWLNSHPALNFSHCHLPATTRLLYHTP